MTLNTYEKIFNRIGNGKAYTRSQLAKSIGVTKKTISNRLSEIHKDVDRLELANYVVVNTNNTRYFMLTGRQPSKNMTFKNKRVKLYRKNLVDGGHSAAVYR